MTTRIVLCGGKSCCPTAEFKDDGSLSIIDDDGKTIELTPEQTQELLRALQSRSTHA